VPNNLQPNIKTTKTIGIIPKITTKTSKILTNSIPQPNNNPNLISSNQTPSNTKTNENQISFANAVSKTQYPKKEQAIIIEITDDI